jgi:hypothetical protein
MLTQTPEREEMTLAEAVAVLNRERHDFDADGNGYPWVILDDGEYVNIYSSHRGYGARVIRAFEAIAIAEKYERLRARETPERERTADEFSDGIDRKAAVANRG